MALEGLGASQEQQKSSQDGGEEDKEAGEQGKDLPGKRKWRVWRVKIIQWGRPRA